MRFLEEEWTERVERAKHLVHISNSALSSIADALALQELSVPNHRFERLPGMLPATDDETFVMRLLVLNAINFAFTTPGEEKFAVQVSGEERMRTGSFGLTTALSRAVEEGIDIDDPAVLRSLTLPVLEQQVFRSDAGLLPLIGSRLHNLRDVGSVLSEAYAGSAMNVLSENRWNAPEIVKALIAHFASYDGDYVDVGTRSGSDTRRVLTFDKRARLFVLMYQGRALDSGGALPLLRGIEHIGTAMDYIIPMILRMRGALVLRPELYELVDAQTPLEPWSSEELSLRLAGDEATMRLLWAVNVRREQAELPAINMLHMDGLLWGSAGQISRAKRPPHHICLTTAY